jgi:hypothetical protein
MNAPFNASAKVDTTQLAISAAVAIAEAPFVELENQSRDLAAMAACGFLTKQAAVDVAHTAALAAFGPGMARRHGADAIQEIISTGFEMAAAKSEPAPRPYRTPQSTIDAFWHVVHLNDQAYLTRWLEDHPLDAPYLHKIWERKCSSAAK